MGLRKTRAAFLTASAAAVAFRPAAPAARAAESALAATTPQSSTLTLHGCWKVPDAFTGQKSGPAMDQSVPSALGDDGAAPLADAGPGTSHGTHWEVSARPAAPAGGRHVTVWFGGSGEGRAKQPSLWNAWACGLQKRQTAPVPSGPGGAAGIEKRTGVARPDTDTSPLSEPNLSCVSDGATTVAATAAAASGETAASVGAAAVAGNGWKVSARKDDWTAAPAARPAPSKSPGGMGSKVEADPATVRGCAKRRLSMPEGKSSCSATCSSRGGFGAGVGGAESLTAVLTF